MDTVRVGVVGTSWYPDWMHLPALKSHPQAQVTAICGRNRERAQELAEKYAIAHVFSDYREMLTRDLLDAVVIAVPDDLHYPITMAALDVGLHVLCEKPLAMNLDQGREMLAKASAAQVVNMTFFTWRWVPYTRLMQKLVDEGFIGACYDAQFEYYGGYARDDYYQWKWDARRGLGVLGDLGSHMIDLAHLLVGDVSRVQARLSAWVVRPHPQGLGYEQANDSASLMLAFANGATGTLFASATVNIGARNQVQRIQLIGSEGTLEMIADAQGYTVRGLRSGEQEFQTFPVPGEFLAGSMPGASVYEELMQTFLHQSIGTRLFIDSILAGCPIVPGIAEGLKVQAVIEAAIRADQSGCWEDVN